MELRHLTGNKKGSRCQSRKPASLRPSRVFTAVLACAALEDALKRYAMVNGLTVDGKTMSDEVNTLRGASLVGGAQKSLLDTMPKIRNMAMNGEWAKVIAPDVASVLGFVEHFLLSKFSDFSRINRVKNGH